MESFAIGLELELTQRSECSFRFSGSASRNTVVMDDAETLMCQSACLGASGLEARKRGNETEAEGYYHDALRLALKVVDQTTDQGQELSRLDILRAAARLALDCGEVTEARRLVEMATSFDSASTRAEDWAQLRNVFDWPDEWLIAAVRRDPPDVSALDVLADRYWKPLFGRCLMLTVNQEKASDLAQQAWYRVLRARNTLKPGGNFPAYLMTVATNLWRDSNRSARRAGPLAESRLASLDASLPTEDGETVALADTLPDLSTLQGEERKQLALDIDQALERLTPLLRDVLVSRLIIGESCAEIGSRYDRTEQTISAWVRQAIREVKQDLEAVDGPTERENQP